MQTITSAIACLIRVRFCSVRTSAAHGHSTQVECPFVIPRYTPMASALVREPFHHAGWIYEEKVDGWRIVTYKDRESVRLVSRTGVDHARRFRDIAAAIAKLSARTLVLDGEVAIFDEQLRSRFDWQREPDRAAVASPPVYMAFDLLYRDGRDLNARRWLREREQGLAARRAADHWPAVALGSRASLPAASWFFPSVGSRLTVWPRGSKSSSAGTRATWPRTRRARTTAARPGAG
jgi:ATP-dependent DNA ligase